jgi:hypothetical protein
MGVFDWLDFDIHHAWVCKYIFDNNYCK